MEACIGIQRLVFDWRELSPERGWQKLVEIQVDLIEGESGLKNPSSSVVGAFTEEDNASRPDSRVGLPETRVGSIYQTSKG